MIIPNDRLTDMTFDTPISRAGSHCSKWDLLEPLYGLKPDEGLAMWVADMEFKPPQAVQTYCNVPR